MPDGVQDRAGYISDHSGEWSADFTDVLNESLIKVCKSQKTVVLPLAAANRTVPWLMWW